MITPFLSDFSLFGNPLLTLVQDLRSPSLPYSVRGLAPNQPSFRILVTDDHEANRQLLVQLLQSIGFEVQSAINGQEAIAIWETWQPHLIWMDMRMPQMDGYEATRWIRAQEYQRRSNSSSSALIASRSTSPHATTIIALTAYAFEDERKKVLSAGCDDFVRKPFQEKELLEKVATYLGVQYVYSEVDETNYIAQTSFDAIAVLQALSPALLNQLYQATIRLNQEELTTLIEQVALVHAPLATLLTEQLNNFEFEKILQLLQQVI